MKHCPSCRTQYTDDTLRFCLQDGSQLQSSPSPVTSDEFNGETPTVVAGRVSNEIPAPPVTNQTNWTPAIDVPPKTGVSGTTFAVFATVFLMLLVFSIVGIGAWIWVRGTNPDSDANGLVAKREPDSDTTSNKATAPIPKPSATTTTNTAPVSTAAKIDGAQISKDVSSRIVTWTSAAESRNLDSYMSNYAPVVHYYNNKTASIPFVRADKSKAFSKYDSISLKIGPINVVPDASGENATAVFDKEWLFEGPESTSSGRVQTQLKLKKIDGQWLISGESDKKVYWTK